MVDDLCDEKVLDGTQIIAQIGNTDYKPRNYKSFHLLGREEFQEYMSAGCTATVPAGARKMYLVMAAISTAVGALIAYAIMNFT